MNMSQAVSKVLKGSGVNYLFGIPGGGSSADKRRSRPALARATSASGPRLNQGESTFGAECADAPIGLPARPPSGFVAGSWARSAGTPSAPAAAAGGPTTPAAASASR